MPGKVIRVGRRERLGLAQRLYLPMIFVGLSVSTRHFARNLWGYLRGVRRTFTVYYPEERVDHPDAFRGHPVLVARETGAPRCVACGLCEFACPTDCISIVPGEVSEGGERAPRVFDIDMSRCMFCGLCEEACPEEAIVMSRDVELASRNREDTLWHLDDLLRSEEQLGRRLAHLRGGYAGA